METKNSYDRISALYNWMSGPFENRYREATLNNFSPAPGERLLEIGFGTGHNLLELARQTGPDGHVTGVDLSRKMTGIARKKLDRARLSERVTLICGDILTCPLPEKSFDGILMSFTLETFDDHDISRLLDKTYKILKPRGRVTILSMARSDHPTLIYRLYLASRRRFPRLVDCRPIKAEDTLRSSGFSISESSCLHIYGLPVSLITAQKKTT